MEGRLSSQRRSRYESTIGATERGRQNLEFARSLLAALKASRTAAARPARYWAAGIAAMLALAVLPAWLAFRVASVTAQLEKLRAESTASEARLRSELSAANRAPTPVEAAFLLTPGMARSGDGPARLQLSAQADTIRFELVPPPGAASGDYVVTIRTPGGPGLWSRSTTLTGRVLIAQAPAKLFSGGAYEIALRRLTAGEQAPDLVTYSFRLLRK